MASGDQDWATADEHWEIPLGDGTSVSPSQFRERNEVRVEYIAGLAARFEQEANNLMDAYSTLSAKLTGIFPDAAGPVYLPDQRAPYEFLYGDCNNGYCAMWGNVSKSISDLIQHVRMQADDPTNGLYRAAQDWFDSMQATLRSCGGLQASQPPVPLSPPLTDDDLRPH